MSSILPIWAIPPEDQYRIAFNRNQERAWGFTETEFLKIGKAPAPPLRRFGVVCLNIQLDTVGQTLREAWRAAKSIQDKSWDWRIFDPECEVRLLPGITHERGLSWKIIDLAAHWDYELAQKQSYRNENVGTSPGEDRNPQQSPHSALLWAASYFPRWVRSMNGRDVPFIWIPGYQVHVSDLAPEPFSEVPRLGWGRMGIDWIGLDAGRYTERYRSWAVPELL